MRYRGMDRPFSILEELAQPAGRLVAALSELASDR